MSDTMNTLAINAKIEKLVLAMNKEIAYLDFLKNLYYTDNCMLDTTKESIGNIARSISIWKQLLVTQ